MVDFGLIWHNPGDIVKIKADLKKDKQREVISKLV